MNSCKSIFFVILVFIISLITISCNQSSNNPTLVPTATPEVIKEVKLTEEQKKEIAKLLEEGKRHEIDGKFEEAIKTYDKALEINPYDEEILGCKGATLAELKKYDEAIGYYDKALRVNPESLYLFNKALALEKQEKYKEALECCNKFLEIEPAKLNENQKTVYNMVIEDVKSRKKWYEEHTK
jgi:tetratricopeptide (TPR) repeat protein